MPAGALTLFHVRGIRISVDYSWFLVLFLIIFSLSGFYRDVLEDPDDAIGPYLLALASALLFFASILLHELGHAVVAIRRGIGIDGITLWMFGGVARLSRDSDSPGDGVQDRDRGAAGHRGHRRRLRRCRHRARRAPRTSATRRRSRSRPARPESRR